MAGIGGFGPVELGALVCRRILRIGDIDGIPTVLGELAAPTGAHGLAQFGLRM